MLNVHTTVGIGGRLHLRTEHVTLVSFFLLDCYCSYFFQLCHKQLCSQNCSLTLKCFIQMTPGVLDWTASTIAQIAQLTKKALTQFAN